MKTNEDICCSSEVARGRNCCNPHKRCHTSTWEQLFNAIQDPVLVVRPDGIIIEANDATLHAAQKSRKEVVGQGICKIVHGGKWPHIKCPLEEFLKTCTPKVEDTRLPGFFGEYSVTISPVKEMDGKIDKIMLIARELTSDEIQKVDSIRTAKLAAIGELAAGVAHEVNNPITGIINFAQILLDNYDLDPAGITIVQKIIDEGDRIASITHNLLSFARADGCEREPVNPVEVVKECLTLVQHQLKMDGIMVVTEYPPNDSFIIADFGQLQQVLLNLISNSRYALNARYPGTDPQKIIKISCLKKEDKEHPVYRLIVKDYGTGLPQSILERIFEPFFTTKPPGEGTGLGLSISYGIIKDHGGDLHVNSILDKFTEMIIELPSKI
ncbi:MAG: PAS domain-containing protein [Proteobacteria bacterium]|nr:PAS domain-containing protein [Pseudomonadota bacterium]MBU1419823.1 PAS domain-containing protein [Pseudomonadota bacterium]MBU1456407.1 PAS domain-containing protein [Pseudomonadota bacterium]